jgi:LysM repeat protein
LIKNPLNQPIRNPQSPVGNFCGLASKSIVYGGFCPDIYRYSLKIMKKTVSLLPLVLFFSVTAYTQKLTPQQYIDKYKADAVKEMIKSGVPASITLGQALLESSNGNSPLAVEANNHFGIKCHKEWPGETYLHDDDKKQECFRKYKTVFESYSDHSQFLRTRTRYASLFELERTDYKAWAHGLKKAGYATNPRYAELLIKIIEENKLYEFDNMDSPEKAGTFFASVSKTDGQTVIAPHKKEEPAPSPDIAPAPARILEENGVKYIIAKKGDTYFKISSEFEMGLWQIFKYNELDKKSSLFEGQRIYIQPKKRKASQKEHIVKAGETLYEVSQLYAIKTKHIIRRNKLKDTTLKPGQKLVLR